MKNSIKLIMGVVIVGVISLSIGDLSLTNVAGDFSIMGAGNPASVLPPA